MKSVAFVYLVYSWEDLAEIQNFEKIAEDPEDYQRCIAEKLCEEMKICSERSIPYYFLLYTPESLVASVDEGQEQWDSLSYEMFNVARERVSSIPEEFALLRANYSEIKKPLAYLESLSIRNVLTWEDEERVLDWYKFVKGDVTKREMKETTLQEVNKELLQKFSSRERVFLKTRAKGISCITDSSLSHIEVTRTLQRMKQDRVVIISEPLDLVADDLGVQEFRVWICNRKVSSISRYVDKDVVYSIPKEIREVADRFIAEYKDEFPLHYVLDLGVDRYKGVVVIELNGLISSGRFTHNDFHCFLDDLIAG